MLVSDPLQLRLVYLHIQRCWSRMSCYILLYAQQSCVRVSHSSRAEFCLATRFPDASTLRNHCFVCEGVVLSRTVVVLQGTLLIGDYSPSSS